MPSPIAGGMVANVAKLRNITRQISKVTLKTESTFGSDATSYLRGLLLFVTVAAKLPDKELRLGLQSLRF